MTSTRMRWYSKTYISVILAFFYAPIAVLILYSFNESKSRSYFTGFTLDWYKKLFTNDMIIQSLINTLILAAFSAVIATIIGTAAAIGIRNMRRWSKSFVLNMTYLPIINPEIVTGVSMMLLFVMIRNGIGWFGNITGLDISFKFGFLTLLLAHITFNIPYVILNVMPKLRQMDQSVYEAALDLGCNEMQAFLKVILPEILPGIIAGFLTAITMSMDDFIISYFVSGPTAQTLPIAIYSMTRRKVSPEINALSTIMFLVILTILLVSNVREGKEERERKRWKEQRL